MDLLVSIPERVLGILCREKGYVGKSKRNCFNPCQGFGLMHMHDTDTSCAGLCTYRVYLIN